MEQHSEDTPINNLSLIIIKPHVPDTLIPSISRFCCVVLSRKILNRFRGAFFVEKPIPEHNNSVYNGGCYTAMTRLATMLTALMPRITLFTYRIPMLRTPCVYWRFLILELVFSKSFVISSPSVKNVLFRQIVRFVE